MSQMLTTFAPLLAFMLIPLWIPLAAVAIGKVGELFGMAKSEPVADKIAALKEHHRVQREERSARPALAHVD